MCIGCTANKTKPINSSRDPISMQSVIVRNVMFMISNVLAQTAVVASLVAADASRELLHRRNLYDFVRNTYLMNTVCRVAYRKLITFIVIAPTRYKHK
jgi:hypothetical protein